MKKICISALLFMGMFCNLVLATPPSDVITTAEKYIEYKNTLGHFEGFVVPHTVIITYQSDVFQSLLDKNPDLKLTKALPNLYLNKDSNVGVLGGWGIGAPALSIKLEQLAVLGVKRFIGVGTAGGLLDKFAVGDFVMASKALGEDGVAHLYLDGTDFIEANLELNAQWNAFAKELNFHETGAWSFSALFRERYSDILRVTNRGFNVVEMETATIFAIAQERGVEALALFVISDTIDSDWKPHLKDPKVRTNTQLLAEKAFQFSQR